MIDAGSIAQMKHDAVVLNFSRSGVVDEEAILAALDASSLAKYVCDFPGPHLNSHPRYRLPHLGASTAEAEENCAVMVAEQVRDYLLDGTIRNSVNFPDVVGARVALPVASRTRTYPTWSAGSPSDMATGGSTSRR